QLPSWRVYNLGVGGYGTNQVYAQLSSDALEDEIGRDSGTGVYVFIDDHLFRNIGSMRVYNLWGRDMPYYCVEGDGLKRKGTFTTGRRWRSFIYNLLGKSRMLKCAGFDWPKAGPEDLLLTARLIRGCADAFHNKFPGSRFVVVFYPGSKFAPQLIELLKAEGGQGLVILDYSRLFDRKDRRFVIEGDGHPSAFANQTLAGQLIKDLGVAAH
ncbi:MAG: hypothetical protein ACE5DN_05785, partial [Flavobacteriales bacterium]